MFKVLLLTCLAGLAAAQYGSGYGRGGSGYGPDGVRNRYFILGHGRGPISTSVGSGIYGTSLGSGGYGSSGGRGSGYGASAPSYSAPARHYAPVYAPAPVSYEPAPVSYAPAVRSYSAPVGHYGASASRGYGGSYGHDDLAQPTPYDFGYDVHSEHGDQQSRKETGDGYGNVKGSYGYRDSYGIYRHVDYVADKEGFRANVKTNEPGTDNQDPADVKMQVEHGGYGY